MPLGQSVPVMGYTANLDIGNYTNGLSSIVVSSENKSAARNTNYVGGGQNSPLKQLPGIYANQELSSNFLVLICIKY